MSSPAKDFHIDAVYPEHLSRLRRSGTKSDPFTTSVQARRTVRKQRKGNTARFRTQPVTFHEIKEVDEENLVDGEELLATSSSSSPPVTMGSTSKSETDLQRKFELFYKSITKDSGTGSESCPEDGTKASSSDRFHPDAQNPGHGQFNPRSRPSL